MNKTARCPPFDLVIPASMWATKAGNFRTILSFDYMFQLSTRNPGSHFQFSSRRPCYSQIMCAGEPWPFESGGTPPTCSSPSITRSLTFEVNAYSPYREVSIIWRKLLRLVVLAGLNLLHIASCAISDSLTVLIIMTLVVIFLTWFLQTMRNQLKAMIGGNFQDDQRGFWQIIAVFLWIPLCLRVVYCAIYFVWARVSFPLQYRVLIYRFQ